MGNQPNQIERDHHWGNPVETTHVEGLKRKTSADTLSPAKYIDKNGVEKYKSLCGMAAPKHGCLKLFESKDFNHDTNLCHRCTERTAADLEIRFEDVGLALCAENNLKYYTANIPVMDSFPEKSQVRMLLSAMGAPIKRATDYENAGADEFRERFPLLCGTVKA